jgi:hypothetical protein
MKDISVSVGVERVVVLSLGRDTHRGGLFGESVFGQCCCATLANV